MSVSSLGIRAKIAGTIVLPLVIVIIMGILTVNSIQNMHATSQWVKHTYEVLGEANAIKANAINMESDIRGIY